ncbi:uncharacterized protein JCM6883_007648 [Sporobolomyces salmoneus]|uniref:uncharacterized protein n=1 Tax=Sporobolomyces salmoneus TaxID=183962 RepID=UPI00316C7FE7
MPLEDIVAKGWTFRPDDRPATRPPRFSDPEINEFKARRRLAKASPLRKGSFLSFTLPSLYPDAIYRSRDESVDSPNPPRRPSAALLEQLKSSKPENKQIKLKKGLVKGKDQYSQVWRGEMKVNGKKYKVILKLYAEALYHLPVPPFFDQGWSSQEERAQHEAEAYATLNSVQGIDVPICYGFYNFSVPWGESVIGVILEDLNEIGVGLEDWVQNYLQRGDGFAFPDPDPDSDSDQESVSTSSDEDEDEEMSVEKAEEHERKLRNSLNHIFRTQRRLHEFGHTMPQHVFVLRTGTLAQPQLVFHGFSHTMSRAEVEAGFQDRYEDVKKFSGARVADKLERDFRATAERGLIRTVRRVLGETLWRTWRNKEYFEFVCRT